MRPLQLLSSIGFGGVVSDIESAVPKITTQFPDALNDVGWYGSAYLLTNTSLQPSFGKVFTYFDVKWTYLSALVIFEGKLHVALRTGIRD